MASRALQLRFSQQRAVLGVRAAPIGEAGVWRMDVENPKRAGPIVARFVLRSGSVARSLHVRLDEASAAALDVVRAEGLTDSEAVRTALREAAARRRVRSAIREEVERIAAHAADREEMRVIREEMAALAPRRSG
jgi:hypothetical protein